MIGGAALGRLARLLRASPAEPAWIETEALAAAANDPLIVDVRGADEFGGPLGHMAGAVNIPVDDIASRAAGLAALNRPIVLVCHTDRRSARAAGLLAEAGLSDVAVLRGGMVRWRGEGRA